jgi:hypothetical protein
MVEVWKASALLAIPYFGWFLAFGLTGLAIDMIFGAG